MSVHKYYVQRDKLVELTQFLDAFKEEINQKMMEYKQRVEYLYESGLPEETRNKFINIHISETQHMVNAINQIIEENSIPFSNQNIELVEHLMALNS